MSSVICGSWSMGLLFAHSAWIDIWDVFIMLSRVSRFNFHCTANNHSSGSISTALQRDITVHAQLPMHWKQTSQFTLNFQCTANRHHSSRSTSNALQTDSTTVTLEIFKQHITFRSWHWLNFQHISSSACQPVTYWWSWCLIIPRFDGTEKLISTAKWINVTKKITVILHRSSG